MKYKYYRQPTRCNNNGLLIIPVSSTCFGELFFPSSGALDCVLQLVVQCTQDVAGRPPAGNIVGILWKYYGKLWNEQGSKGEEGTEEERRSEGKGDNEDIIIEELNEVLKLAKKQEMLRIR